MLPLSTHLFSHWSIPLKWQCSKIEQVLYHLKSCRLTVNYVAVFFQSSGLGSSAALFGGSGRHITIITPGKPAGKSQSFYSVSDPDSVRSVDPYPDSKSGSGSRRARFLCFEVLDVLFWGLKASSVRQLGNPLWRPREREAVVFDPKKYFFSSKFFFHQNPGSGSGLEPDPDRYPIQPKMLDPDLYQMSMDPKHCFFAKRRHILASIKGSVK